MKRTILSIIFAILYIYAWGQKDALSSSDKIYSVTSGPGENASTEIGISWAADSTLSSTYVLVTLKNDTNWEKAFKVHPEQECTWTAFNGVFSDRADGTEFYEDVQFVKCGAMIRNLKPDTDYKYMIVDGKDSSITSDTRYFKTAGAKNWSCCLISDIHSYTPLPGRLVAAMGVIDTMQEKDPSIDFVLSAGDVVAWGGSYSFWRRLFEEDNFKELMWARANGNHDNWTKQSQITRNFDIPNDYFLGTSYYPRNSYESQMGVNYHFRYGNTLFIMVNSEDLRLKGETQKAKDWVRTVVTEAKASKNPPMFCVVCLHYEWFVGTNGKTSEYGRWHELFDEVGIDLAIAGNNHVYVRTEPIFEGKTGTGRGTVYMQTPSSDNGRGRDFHESRFDNQEYIKFRWTEGSHTIGAIHMSVSPRRIDLELIDRTGKTVDSTSISK